jgi:TRAP-type mannitol/chloroaromatic compound transport system permease large subunit
MLEIYELLVIALLASFILLIFTGYPIAWVLAGVSFWFPEIALWLPREVYGAAVR